MRNIADRDSSDIGLLQKPHLQLKHNIFDHEIDMNFKTAFEFLINQTRSALMFERPEKPEHIQFGEVLSRQPALNHQMLRAYDLHVGKIWNGRISTIRTL
jgi:hypothetical protein